MITTVKEKPILFSTPMVKAILEGRKTQTRRVIKLKKNDTIGNISDSTGILEYIICDKDGDVVPLEFISSYGVEGDKLWVRETWATDKKFDKMNWQQICNTGVETIPFWYKVNDNQLENPNVIQGRWRSGRFCPKETSRITLEVTQIRIQRLQDITEEDAISEGCQPEYILASPTIFHKGRPNYTETPMNYRGGFKILWDSINGKIRNRKFTLDDKSNRHWVKDQIGEYSWQSNPFVWAVSFKVVK